MTEIGGKLFVRLRELSGKTVYPKKAEREITLLPKERSPSDLPSVLKKSMTYQWNTAK